MRLLADTSALLGALRPDDRNHEAATAFLRRNVQIRFVVTELILAELATRLRARGSAERAVASVRDILNSQRHQTVFVDAALFTDALTLMAKFSDKTLSLTDCASFVLMDRIGVRTAFTFDRDFRDCGYEMVP